MPDRNKYWLGVKTEYIFDNTRNLGINLYSGTRLKLFTEAYKKLNDGYDDLYVVGMDIRNYFQIHRNLIFASRLAASASYGSNLLIYYLGGVDNWTNLIPNRVPTFIPTNEIPIDYEKDYAFQTVATNMRGFSQNIRNGDRFALMNFELRWPVISYFMNYPLSSSMLENFQVVGFFDVGSAWSGMTPYSGENAYNNKVYPRTYPGDEPSGPYKITVDAQRDPIVAGYGAGVRTQVLGYFVRLDWAWGIENRTILPRVFYFSLSLDF
jgi:outer membrane protein assembly factor BamA